jgi:hypothetical protein
MILNYSRRFHGNKIKLLTEYESVTQKVLWQCCIRRIDVWEEIWRHNSKWRLRLFETYTAIKMQRRYRIQYRKIPPSDNIIRRWLKQPQETGSVLRRKGAERTNTSQEDADRIQEEFSRSPQNLTRRDSLQLDIPQTTLWMVVHNRLHLHAYKVQSVQSGEFHTFHTQLKTCHGNIFQFCRMSFNSLTSIPIPIKFLLLKNSNRSTNLKIWK